MSKLFGRRTLESKSCTLQISVSMDTIGAFGKYFPPCTWLLFDSNANAESWPVLSHMRVFSPSFIPAQRSLLLDEQGKSSHVVYEAIHFTRTHNCVSLLSISLYTGAESIPKVISGREYARKRINSRNSSRNTLYLLEWLTKTRITWRVSRTDSSTAFKISNTAPCVTLCWTLPHTK